MDSDDVSEDTAPDTEYVAYKRIVSAFQVELNNFEQRLIDMSVAFEDTQRAQQAGLENVYAKFCVIEKRQIEIETLLKSDRIVELVKNIPTDQDIKKLLSNVDQTDIGKLNKNIKNIRDELERLTDAFNI